MTLGMKYTARAELYAVADTFRWTDMRTWLYGRGRVGVSNSCETNDFVGSTKCIYYSHFLCLTYGSCRRYCMKTSMNGTYLSKKLERRSRVEIGMTPNESCYVM